MEDSAFILISVAVHQNGKETDVQHVITYTNEDGKVESLYVFLILPLQPYVQITVHPEAGALGLIHAAVTQDGPEIIVYKVKMTL